MMIAMLAASLPTDHPDALSAPRRIGELGIPPEQRIPCPDYEFSHELLRTHMDSLMDDSPGLPLHEYPQHQLPLALLDLPRGPPPPPKK